MKSFGFALRRIASSKTYLIFLLTAFLLIFAASFYGSFSGFPPAGVLFEANSEISDDIFEYLNDNGFIAFTDEQKMLAELEAGRLDCAVLFPADFEERIKSGVIKNSIRFVQTPSSFAADIYKNHVVAAVFDAVTPYIVAGTLAESAITAAETVNEYEKMTQEGYLFSFLLQDADGSLPQNHKAHDLTLAAAAFLLFIGINFFSVDIIDEKRAKTMLLLGRSRGLNRIILPKLLLRVILSFLVSAAALYFAYITHGDKGFLDIIPALGIYALCLAALSLLLASFMPSANSMNILLTILLLISLAVCPVFIDFGVFSPLLQMIRYLLPCYWLWVIGEQPFLWAIGGIIMLIVSYFALLRFGKSYKE